MQHNKTNHSPQQNTSHSLTVTKMNRLFVSSSQVFIMCSGRGGRKEELEVTIDLTGYIGGPYL